MSYLLRISYGPVQSFISASRKTKDLKAGSDLLVEIGGKILKTIEENDKSVKPIFPSEIEGANCANVILVEVTQDPKKLAEEAEKAAEKLLLDKVSGLEFVDSSLAKEQAERFLEFYAAWTEAKDGACKVLDKKFAARKGIREFEQVQEVNFIPGSKYYRPKSPLLPEFETVLNLKKGDNDPKMPLNIVEGAIGKYQLKQREYLDAISLVKRSSPAKMPSTSQVSIRDLALKIENEEKYPGAKLIWDEVKSMLEQIKEDHGTWLYDSMDQNFEELAKARKGFIDAIPDGDKEIRLRRYYAIIHADGDSMGKAIDQLSGNTDHLRRFSKALDSFSGEVKEIAGDHVTEVVYAGGDDVLAMVPMSQAVGFAKAIHEVFCEKMKEVSATLLRPDNKPTLSVGIAVVHVKEDLNSAVALSAEMEHFAKKMEGKDAVAICIRNHGGGEVKYRCKWNDIGTLEYLLKEFSEGDPPRGFPYEIRDEARLLARLPKVEEWMVEGAYLRIKEKKAKDAPKMPKGVKTPKDLEHFADALIIAHFMTRKGDSLNGKEGDY